MVFRTDDLWNLNKGSSNPEDGGLRYRQRENSGQLNLQKPLEPERQKANTSFLLKKIEERMQQGNLQALALNLVLEGKKANSLEAISKHMKGKEVMGLSWANPAQSP